MPPPAGKSGDTRFSFRSGHRSGFSGPNTVRTSGEDTLRKTGLDGQPPEQYDTDPHTPAVTPVNTGRRPDNLSATGGAGIAQGNAEWRHSGTQITVHGQLGDHITTSDSNSWE